MDEMKSLLCILWSFIYVTNCSALSVPYPLTQYDQINFSELRLIKRAFDEGIQREVYEDAKYYYKVWDVGYSKEKTFVNALKRRYFHDIAQIHSIIVDEKGNCRGYITMSGELSKGLKVYQHNGFMVLRPGSEQSPQYRDLYARIYRRIKDFGMVYFDLVHHNIMMLKNKYYIIDLESVFMLPELRDMSLFRRDEFLFVLSSLPEEYQEVIVQEINSLKTRNKKKRRR